MTPESRAAAPVPAVGRWRKVLVVLLLGTGTFITATSNNISILLPMVERDTGVTMMQAEWLMLAYFLALVLFLLPAGRLGDLLGHRNVFFAGGLLMLAANVVMTLSKVYLWLVAGRFFMGLAASLIAASGPALISLTFPPQEKGRALGWQSVLTYTGQSAAPVLGGWLGTRWGWHAFFLVNIPVILAVLAAGVAVLPKPAGRRKVRFDGVGSAWLMVAMLAFVLAADSGMHGWRQGGLALLCALA
ncbi:MAG: MFS transporter, partial [Alicyclobacillus sp.]|nr:MFS transporter [Alicyclobacillus sp.]